MTDIKQIYGQGLNLFKSPHDEEQWQFKDAVPMHAFMIPEDYITEGIYEFGYDQKTSSMCAASAYSFIRTLQERDIEQSGLKGSFSPTWSYGLRVDGAYEGEGMCLADVCKGGRKFGSVLYEELDYPLSYIASRNLVKNHLTSLSAKAEPFKISSYYACSSLREIQIAIMETKAVLIGVPCFDSIFQPDSKGKVRYIPGQEDQGGHALACCGWIKDAEGFWWVIKNSWGSYTRRGDGTTFLLSADYPWLDQAYVIVDHVTDMKFNEYKEKFGIN